MKALSLWQPWASLMAIGAKRIETRGWSMRHRGPLVICATATWNRRVLAELRQAWPGFLATEESDWKAMAIALRAAGYRSVNALPLGAALCVVEVYGCISADVLFDPAELDAHRVNSDELAFGDFSAGRYAILTRNVRRFPEPIPCKGAQGLWEFPDNLVPGTEG